MQATRRPITVVALMLGLFMAAMEMTVVSTAMPTAEGALPDAVTAARTGRSRDARGRFRGRGE